jgi:hypothetical protein
MQMERSAAPTGAFETAPDISNPGFDAKRRFACGFDPWRTNTSSELRPRVAPPAVDLSAGDSVPERSRNEPAAESPTDSVARKEPLGPTDVCI